MLVALLAHAGQLRRIVEQGRDRVGQAGAVAEREQAPAPFGEELLGVPVGRRDDRRPRAHRVRERAARDLGLVEVGAHEDVGRLQVAAQLLGRDVLIAEHDVLANAQLLGQSLERRAVGLAVLAKHGRMRGADDEVDEIGIRRDEGRQGADDGLDALVRPQQAEGEEHALPGDAEARLEPLLVARRHVRDAVGDDLDARNRQLVASREQVGGDLAHDDDAPPPWPSSARSPAATATACRGRCAA